MSQFGLAAVMVLGVLVIAQSFILVVILRHIGVLYERIGPVGALMTSSPLAVGARAPAFELPDLAGRSVRIGQPNTASQGAQLLLFVAPTCPLCRQLTSFVRSFAHAERAAVSLVLASDGPAEDHRAYVARHKLDALPYVVSTALGLAYGVSKLPYAVLIDRDGIVRARGLVNSREHLESLVEALETGTASLQQWIQRAQSDALVA